MDNNTRMPAASSSSAAGRRLRRRRPPAATAASSTTCFAAWSPPPHQGRRPHHRALAATTLPCPSDVNPTEHVEQSLGTNLAGLGDRSFPSDLVPALAIDLACGRKSPGVCGKNEARVGRGRRRGARHLYARAGEEAAAAKKRDANLDGNEIAARIFPRGGGKDGNLLLMPSCFANLLEAIFSCFAKNR